MRALLSDSFQRKLTLIDYLYDNPYQKLTTIQEHFQYNHTTLLNDLADLNSIISPCEIIKTANLEYFLHFPNNTNIEYVYACFLQVSPEFRLLQQLIFNTYPSTEALAEALYVSNSTVKRMITRINQILLEKFSFKIQTSPLTFSGDETKIINFFIAFLKESHLTSTQLLSKEQNIFFNQLFEESLPILKFAGNIDIDKFSFYVYSIVLRFKQVGSLAFFSENRQLYSNLTDYSHLFDRYFSIKTDTSFFHSLESIFFNGHYLKSYKELVFLSKENQQILTRKTQIEQLLDYLATTLAISNPNYHAIVLYLYNLSVSDYGEAFILFPKYKFFLENLTHHYPYFYDKCVPFLKKILNDKSIDRFYEFIYHLIIRWDELQASLNKLPPKMKTGIYFFTDIEHNLFMKKFFTERFRDILAIDNLFTLDSSVDLKEVAASYDLLLTNIPIPDGVERNIICCSLFPTNAQLEEIASYYSKWLTTTN